MGVLGLHPSWYINVNLVICHSPKIMRPPFSLLTPILKTLLPLFIVCCTLLVGCGSSAPALKPFKMDIQQGNVVTSKMLLQLKPGMTKSQVRFIMGTPLIVDSFHKNRWDYFYQMRQAGKIVEQRRVILDFEKDLLTKVRGDVVPQGTAGDANGVVDAGEGNVVNAPITVEPKPKEVSMLDKLKFWKKDEKVLAKPEVKSELVTPITTAPLEAAIVALPVVVAATEEAKPEQAKPEMVKPEAANLAAEKSVPEKSISEKSWLDKLKFWKKNQPTAAETAALEEAKAETAAASAANNAARSEVPIVEAPSLLAVPIELPTESAKETIIKDESVQVEPLRPVAPLRTKPIDAKKAPSITGKDSLKPFKSPSQKMLPAKPEFIKPLPEKPAVPSSVFNKPPRAKPAPIDSQLSRPLKPLPAVPKKDEELIFRMDKTLDLELGQTVNPQVMPEPTVSASNNTTKPIKTDLDALPVEAAPSFFDKMLEKIGF